MHAIRRSKTLYFLSALFLCGSLLYILRKPLVSFALEWHVKHRLERRLGGSLKIDKTRRENGLPVFEGVRLYSAVSGNETQLKFYAKQITLDYDFSLLQRKPVLKLFLKEPVFTPQSTIEMLLKIVLNMKSRRPNLFSLEWEFSVPDGKIAVNNETLLPFVLETSAARNPAGNFSILFESLDSDKNIYSNSLKGIIVNESPEERSVRLFFENTPLLGLTAYFDSLNVPLKDLSVTSGSVEGNATITFTKRDLPKFEGELTFTDVNVNHAPLSFDIKIPKARFKRSVGTSGLETSLSIPEPYRFTFRGKNLSEESAALNIATTIKPLTNGVYEIEGRMTTAEGDSLLASCTLSRDFVTENCRFEAPNLSLEKFVRLFVAPNSSFTLKGEADFKGTLKNEILTVESRSKNLYLDTDYFRMEPAPKSDEPGSNEIALTGKHELNFTDGELQGNFLLKNASLIEKSRGILFTEVCGNVSEKNGNIEADRLSGYCSGLYFTAGIRALKKSQSENDFELTMVLESLNGTVANLKHFLSRFPALAPLHLDAVPLEGNISLIKGPKHLIYDSQLNSIEIQETLSGSISEGKFDCPVGNLTLHELGCDFSYDPRACSLDFDQIHGTLFLGAPENAEELAISGNLCFRDLAKQQATFDFAFENNDRRLVRLAGSSVGRRLSNNRRQLHIDFNKDLSRLQEISPIEGSLTLTPSFHIDRFRMGFDLSLAKIASELKHFAKTSGILREISKETLPLIDRSSGTLGVELSYDQRSGPFRLNMKGNHLQIGSQSIREFLFDLKKQGNFWSIDRLQFDDLSIAADMIKEDRKWVFNFLGIRLGSSLLMGLKGEYLTDKRTFAGSLNLPEIAGVKQSVHDRNPIWFSLEASDTSSFSGKLMLSDNQGGFSCSGQWALDKEENRFPAFTFEGKMTGNNAAFCGYEVEFLQADCRYGHGNLCFRDFNIQDPSGFAQINRADIVRNDEGKWKLSIEDCEIRDWRPSLLRSVEKGEAFCKNPVSINTLKFNKIVGILSDPSTFIGNGELRFNYGNEEHSSFAVPQESFDRTSGDPSLPVPTSGIVYFTVRAGKFFPTKFKDVFSDKRLSRFHLAGKPFTSYMDFNGNLNLNIRVKHNVLYKMTDLFTFTVTGTLDKPRYTVSRK